MMWGAASSSKDAGGGGDVQPDHETCAQPPESDVPDVARAAVASEPEKGPDAVLKKAVEDEEPTAPPCTPNCNKCGLEIDLYADRYQVMSTSSSDESGLGQP